MLKKILYISSSMILFLAGVIAYGALLNVREPTLKEAMETKGITKLDSVTIVVDKSKYRLNLFSGITLVKSYKASIGRNRKNFKTSYKDRITPVGIYYICDISDDDEYELFLKLSYPSVDNASEALRENLITKQDYRRIVNAENMRICKPEDIPLGVPIGIHGFGRMNFVLKNLPFVFNWTNGSVAVNNDNIIELSKIVEVGTRVEIIN